MLDRKVTSELTRRDLILVLGSRLADADLRKKLADCGQKAIEESKDPMIELARLVDPPLSKASLIFWTKQFRSGEIGPTF